MALKRKDFPRSLFEKTPGALKASILRLPYQKGNAPAQLHAGASFMISAMLL